MEKQPQEKKKTRAPKESKRDWILIDAEDKILGRLAAKIAPILMGKNKIGWQPHLDGGDYVIVINAAKVATTGVKEGKKYYRYSGYPGGLRVETLKSKRKRAPQDIIYHSVAGMLPKTKLGRLMIKKLFVYPGETHPHEAQKPMEWKG